MLFTSVLVLLFVVPIFSDNLTVSTDCPLSFDYLYPTCPDWKEHAFDFIIIGGGTAGCTLANRLTENPDWNVLLIESGGVPSNLSEIPGLYITLQKTSEDWSFKAQDPSLFRGYKNSESLWAKGKALGGSSTINAMVIKPGIPADYNRWADLGNDGWNWSNVTEYFDKVYEQVKITRYRSPLPMRDTLDAAVQELGIDTTGSDLFGYRDVPLQVYEGQRYSHAKAYLSPIRDRENLCVLTGMMVTGLSFDQEGTVQGILATDSTGTEIKIKADIEVILSAGAINTPKLLMLSGIGPWEHLQSIDIPLRVDLPAGQNLMDHMVIPVFIQDMSTPDEICVTDLEQRLEEYCVDRSILDTIGVTNFQGYINTHDITQPRPNLEMIHFPFPPQEPLLNITLDRFSYLDQYQRKLLQINADKHLQIIMINVLYPESRGTIKLPNTDPLSPPDITPNYLSHSQDIQSVLEGFAFIEQLINTESLRNYELVDLDIPDCVQFQFKTTEYWECFARTFASTIYHPCGTCTMGNDPTKSVVNSRLQVWGVPNLKVVDSSVIPELIAGHTNIPVGMIAEKAADFIKEDYNYLT